MDVMKVDACQGGIRNISKYAIAVATKNRPLRPKLRALLNNFNLHYGVLSKLLSDQGANFEGEFSQELCKHLVIEKLRTTPYHPQF